MQPCHAIKISTWKAVFFEKHSVAANSKLLSHGGKHFHFLSLNSAVTENNQQLVLSKSTYQTQELNNCDINYFKMTLDQPTHKNHKQEFNNLWLRVWYIKVICFPVGPVNDSCSQFLLLAPLILSGPSCTCSSDLSVISVPFHIPFCIYLYLEELSLCKETDNKNKK